MPTATAPAATSSGDWQPINAAATPAPNAQAAPAALNDESQWQPIGTQSSAPTASIPSGKPSLSDIGGGLASAFGTAAQNVKSAAESGVDQIKQGFDQGQNVKTPLDAIEAPLKVGAGVVNTIASPLAAVTTPVVKPLVDAASNAISNVPAVQKFAQSPLGNATSRVVGDVANADTIAGGVAGEESAPEGATGLKDTAAAVNDKLGSALSPFKTSSELQASATADINKGLGNTGKTTATGLLSKDADRLKGMETHYNVTKNQPITRPDGTTFNFDPTNITDPGDLISAFVQAKNQIWSKVQDGLAKGSSITPDYAPVELKLQDVIDNSASKSLVTHAQSRLQEIQTLKTQGVQGAQRYLQEELNPRIGAAVSGATDAPALKLDATVANGVNNALDSGLSKVKDASIRPYKDMYASLKSIEPDLVKMSQKVLRSSGGGIPQYINDFGNLDLLDAVLTHNPALYVARGIGKKVLASVLQSQRSPLDHLSSAFRSIQVYSGNSSPLAETPTLALPPGTPGAASIVSPGYKMSLPARTQSTVDAQEAARVQSQLPPGNQ